MCCPQPRQGRRGSAKVTPQLGHRLCPQTPADPWPRPSTSHDAHSIGRRWGTWASGGASCHLNPGSRGSSVSLPYVCSNAVGFWLPLPLSTAPAPCCQVSLSTCTARQSPSLHYKPPIALLVLPVLPTLKPMPIFPKIRFKEHLPSLTSLCHPLDCWSTAALPQLSIHTPILPFTIAILCGASWCFWCCQWSQEAKRGSQLQSLQHKEDKPFCAP